MMVIGTGVAYAGIRSAVPSAVKPSISSWQSASTRGLSRSTWRDTKARLTRVLSLVCAGGSSSSMECASIAAKSLWCGSG